LAIENSSIPQSFQATNNMTESKLFRRSRGSRFLLLSRQRTKLSVFVCGVPSELMKLLEPHFPTEQALNQEVVDGLGQLGTERAVVLFLELMATPALVCPAPILQDKPNKHATFVGSPDFPELLSPEERSLAVESCRVCRTGVVNA
jgi:hypothetical protein